MKTIRCLLLTAIFISSLFCVVDAKQDVNILEYFDEQYVTSVYIDDIKNSTEDKNIDLSLLKRTIEDAFLARVSQQFDIADSQEEADIVMNIEITEYLFTEEDPVDNLLGIGGVAMDAAKQENYARMIAIFKITDVKSSEVIWEDTLKATITDETMTEDASYDMVNERIAGVLMRNLFSRHKNR